MRRNGILVLPTTLAALGLAAALATSMASPASMAYPVRSDAPQAGPEMADLLTLPNLALGVLGAGWLLLVRRQRR